MLYVGFTEDHEKSARMFASIVGAQVLSHSKSTPPDSQLKSTDQASTIMHLSLFICLFLILHD